MTSLDVKDYYMRRLWNVPDVNQHITNMSRKATGSGRNLCRNKNKIAIAVTGEKQRLLASCEKSEATVAHLSRLTRASIQIS
jgi:hypothetical protein